MSCGRTLRAAALEECLAEYAERSRRFGGRHAGAASANGTLPTVTRPKSRRSAPAARPQAAQTIQPDVILGAGQQAIEQL